LKDNNDEKSMLRQVFEASTVGIQLVVSTFAGLAIGYGLDKLFGTSFLKFIFLAFGIVAGFWEIFKVVKKQEEKDSGRTDSTDDSKDH
jgi:ATP synthase protein I